MDTRVQIDWLSFSVPVVPYSGEVEIKNWHEKTFRHIIEDNSQFKLAMSYFPNQWQNGNGRPPYSYSRSQFGFMVFWGLNTPTGLIEVSGKGCDNLFLIGMLDHVVKSVEPSRIDIAVDVVCDTRPLEILENYIVNPRVRSRSTIKSDTGETVYIGSKKSDRYMRVYRYDGDHPRSNLLRFEFVMRHKYARAIVQDYYDGLSLSDIANSLGEKYGITHPAFKEPVHKANIKGLRGRTSENKTMLWLIRQAAPAFKRLVRSEMIENPQKWLYDTFME